jgi:hypothetical protein
MGCDVHMYAEKFNPKNRKWEKVSDKFYNSYAIDVMRDKITHNFGLTDKEATDIIYRYLSGKNNPKNKIEDYIMNKFLKPSITDDPNFPYWKDESKFPYPYTDQPYGGRNYSLFGALAGVRDGSMELIADMDRGLPDDVSDELCNIFDEWGMDAHSANYLYLDEIMNSSYYKMSDSDLYEVGVGTYFFRDVVDALLDIGNPKDVRLVFWFDN